MNIMNGKSPQNLTTGIINYACINNEAENKIKRDA